MFTCDGSRRDSKRNALWTRIPDLIKRNTITILHALFCEPGSWRCESAEIKLAALLTRHSGCSSAGSGTLREYGDCYSLASCHVSAACVRQDYINGILLHPQRGGGHPLPRLLLLQGSEGAQSQAIRKKGCTRGSNADVTCT